MDHKSKVLRSALRLAHLPLLVFDGQRRLLEFSPAACDLFPQLAPGITLADIWNDSDLDALMYAFTVMEAAPAPFTTNLLCRQAGVEEPRHLSWKGEALRDTAGEIEYYSLVGTDQTYQEKLESELKKSFRLIRDHKMALDESSIVAITDHAGRIQYVNDTFCRISGYEREELIGKTHRVVKSEHHGPEFFKSLWSTISAGHVWKGEIQNKTKDGLPYWVDTTIVPFCGENGRPYQYVAIRNDITEKKQIQEKLESERLRTIYAEKMASLGELAAGIAHELGNPAASINAWLDVIESQHERDALDLGVFMQTVPKVRRDAKRIRDIIRGMLAYARDGSRDPFQSETAQTILQQVIDYCGYKLRKCGVQISLEVPNPYLSFDCRSTEISQMFVNFILNACDAIAEQAERWIVIKAFEVNNSIVFHIIDSGPGIEPEIAEKMFHPFFTTKPIGQGTGLGLSIVRSIVDNHGGTMRLDAEHPNTCFVITLPRRQTSED